MCPCALLCALTGTCDGLVDGTDVDTGGRGLSVGFWDQPDDSHFCVELLGPGLNQLSALAIPACSLHEQTVDVAAHIWLLRQLCHRLDPHLKENNTKKNKDDQKTYFLNRARSSVFLINYRVHIVWASVLVGAKAGRPCRRSSTLKVQVEEEAQDMRRMLTASEEISSSGTLHQSWMLFSWKTSCPVNSFFPPDWLFYWLALASDQLDKFK